MALRFDDFILDGDTRRLLRDGAELHLSPKAFDLLNALVANRTRAMSKAELLELIWPSTFVEETNLAGLVLEIRRTLRDTAATPKFIRTSYGFGYHFVGEVTDDAHSMRATAPQRQRSWLTFDDRRLPLMEGEQVIGRASDVAIPLDLAGVSRYHARIAVVGSEATLEDLGSKNGTLVNGKRISAPVPLADGDEIQIGGVVLTFRITATTSPTETIAV